MVFFKKKKKLLIIGLDGVPYEMIGEFTENSLMPNLKKILTLGKLTKMSVSIPEISSVSWSGFMTGTDSGNHSIFGFVDLIRGKYQYRFPDFRDLKVSPFFEELGLRKKKSVIINLPVTYPAHKIPGVLISGFVALDLKKAVYPLKYLPLLEKSGYQVDVDTGKGKDKKGEFISDLYHTLEVRKRVADFFWEKEKWDLFMFTVTGTDRLHHFLFDAYLEENNRFHIDFLNYYKKVDKIIGDFYNRIEGREEFELIILSDHGFGPIKNEVYINPILKKNGFFDTETSDVKSLTSIKGDSKAFAIDPSRIFVNLKDKFPKGNVNKNDYEIIRNDIKQLFEGYEIGGKRVINNVYYKEDIYSNRFLDMAPDIVLLSNHGFDLKGGLKKGEEYGRSNFTGMHLQDNAFFFFTKPELVLENMTIFDVKDIIFRLLEINL